MMYLWSFSFAWYLADLVISIRLWVIWAFLALAYSCIRIVTDKIEFVCLAALHLHFE